MTLATETRRIEGNPGKPLMGSGLADNALIDKRAGVTTVTISNAGPDSLDVTPITIVSGSGASTVYTLGTAVAVAAGASTTVAGLSRMTSLGRARVRIVET